MLKHKSAVAENVIIPGNCSGAKWQRHIGAKGYRNTRKVFHPFFHFVPLPLCAFVPT